MPDYRSIDSAASDLEKSRTLVHGGQLTGEAFSAADRGVLTMTLLRHTSASSDSRSDRDHPIDISRTAGPACASCARRTRGARSRQASQQSGVQLNKRRRRVYGTAMSLLG